MAAARAVRVVFSSPFWSDVEVGVLSPTPSDAAAALDETAEDFLAVFDVSSFSFFEASPLLEATVGDAEVESVLAKELPESAPD